MPGTESVEAYVGIDHNGRPYAVHRHDNGDVVVYNMVTRHGARHIAGSPVAAKTTAEVAADLFGLADFHGPWPVNLTSGHVVRITETSPGRWDWDCAECRDGASEFETAGEVLADAVAHGPLAADSTIPRDYADDEL